MGWIPQQIPPSGSRGYLGEAVELADHPPEVAGELLGAAVVGAELLLQLGADQRQVDGVVAVLGSRGGWGSPRRIPHPAADPTAADPRHSPASWRGGGGAGRARGTAAPAARTRISAGIGLGICRSLRAGRSPITPPPHHARTCWSRGQSLSGGPSSPVAGRSWHSRHLHSGLRDQVEGSG